MGDAPGDADAPGETPRGAASAGSGSAPGEASPDGLLDLRATGAVPGALRYPPDAVVVVAGLPGSGKSTLLHRWSGRVGEPGGASHGAAGAPAVRLIDPRAVHLACEAAMPHWLPYPVYRPWARWRLLREVCAALRGDGPVLVHDCGSRAWLRRLLARATARHGRTLHLVLLDVGAATALSGQRARARWVRRRVFARHRRGLDRLLRTLDRPAAGPSTALPDALADVTSLVALDARTRERVAAVRFDTAPERRGAGGPESLPPRGAAGPGPRICSPV
ncbi:AAA family ATPase [Streptomyces sp. NBC_01525]|uniref:AAA family ATPase n=1 Tax=Streptomyces sp. NBC_01525 TaxID=2903893 RepID=UPI003864E705